MSARALLVARAPTSDPDAAELIRAEPSSRKAENLNQQSACQRHRFAISRTCSFRQGASARRPTRARPSRDPRAPPEHPEEKCEWSGSRARAAVGASARAGEGAAASADARVAAKHKKPQHRLHRWPDSLSVMRYSCSQSPWIGTCGASRSGALHLEEMVRKVEWPHAKLVVGTAGDGEAG
eukprot:5090097-Pleurochrysis_carterae.AAC.5